MKKVLFVINTLGGAGAERALLELLKRFTPNQYEVDLYILLEQGELISQVPEYVNILNRNYTAESVLSAEGKKKLNKKVFMRLFTHGALFKNIPYLVKNAAAMLGRKKIYADKLLWRVMSDSGMKLNKNYDMAVAYLEGGSTYFVHDHVTAEKKFTFLHVDYKYAGYTRELDRDCYLDFDRIFTVSGEVKTVFNNVYPECRNKTLVFHNLIDREEICRKAELPGGFSDAYSGKRILTVGRLTAQKAYELAIDAMKLLKDQGVKARWYVLGEGELRNKLQQKIDSLGLKEDFLLLGAVENPYPYYKQCDLYVHATRFEGKSIAIQEAQVLGCTILVSDCSGNREQVENGTDGVLCQLSSEEISRNIAELLRDEEKCRQYGKMAVARISSEQGDILKLFEIAKKRENGIYGEQRKHWKRRKKEVLIIIPAYNEEKTIVPLLEKLEQPEIAQVADVLVMNDASQDATNHVTKKRKHDVVTHVFNLGYGSGLQLGYKYAVRKGYRYVIQMDADGQHDVCNILRIYKELQTEDENGALPDIVLGSRFMEGSSGFPVSFAKKIAFVWFRIMLKTGTGRRITDPTTGLQGLNWRTFLFYSKYNNFDDKYPDANMLMQMLLLGFRVREIPAVMHVRTTGVSMHSGLKPVLYMFRMTFSILAVWIREKILKMDEDKIHELEKYDE